MGHYTLAAALALAATGSASAGLAAGTASFALLINGASQTASNNAVDLGDGRFANSGFWAQGGMLVQWNNLITSSTVVNGIETAYISGGFTIKNNSAGTPMVIDLAVFMTGSMAANANFTGSAGGQGVNFAFTPGSLGAVGGAPVWAGFVNGSQVGGAITTTQSVNPFSLASFAPQSFQGSAGSVTDGVGMRLRLSMSAGMESSFSGAFSVTSVPAPGAVALAGCAGLLGGRRRR